MANTGMLRHVHGRDALAGGGHGHGPLRHLGKQSDVSGIVELLACDHSLRHNPVIAVAPTRVTRIRKTTTGGGRGQPVASVIINRRPTRRNEKQLPICPPSGHRAAASSLRPVPGKDISACHCRHRQALISAGLPPGLPGGPSPVCHALFFLLAPLIMARVTCPGRSGRSDSSACSVSRRARAGRPPRPLLGQRALLSVPGSPG